MSLRSKLRKVAKQYKLSLTKLTELHRMNSELIQELVAELNDAKAAHKHDKRYYKSLLNSALKALYSESQQEAITILKAGLGS